MQQHNMTPMQRPIGMMRPNTPPQSGVMPITHQGQMIAGSVSSAINPQSATQTVTTGQRLLIKSPPQYQMTTNNQGQLVAMRPTQVPANAVRGQWSGESMQAQLGPHPTMVRLAQPVILSPNITPIGQQAAHHVNSSAAGQQLNQTLGTAQIGQTVGPNGPQMLQATSMSAQPIGSNWPANSNATVTNGQLKTSLQAPNSFAGNAQAIVLTNRSSGQSNSHRFQLTPQQAAEANSQVRTQSGLLSNANAVVSGNSFLVTSRTKSALANLLNHRLSQAQAGNLASIDQSNRSNAKLEPDQSLSDSCTVSSTSSSSTSFLSSTSAVSTSSNSNSSVTSSTVSSLVSLPSFTVPLAPFKPASSVASSLLSSSLTFKSSKNASIHKQSLESVSISAFSSIDFNSDLTGQVSLTILTVFYFVVNSHDYACFLASIFLRFFFKFVHDDA
jgi:hypothetical protein